MIEAMGPFGEQAARPNRAAGHGGRGGTGSVAPALRATLGATMTGKQSELRHAEGAISPRASAVRSGQQVLGVPSAKMPPIRDQFRTAFIPGVMIESIITEPGDVSGGPWRSTQVRRA